MTPAPNWVVDHLVVIRTARGDQELVIGIAGEVHEQIRGSVDRETVPEMRLAAEGFYDLLADSASHFFAGSVSLPDFFIVLDGRPERLGDSAST